VVDYDRLLIYRVTLTYFLYSYLRQLFWPPCCRKRKCRHFKSWYFGVAFLALALSCC